MAEFPSNVKVFGDDLVNLVNIVFVEHVNPLRHEMVAVQTVLGTNPHGSFSTVRDRIAALEGGKVNKAGDTMTGHLTLSGPAVNALHAATKGSVDEVDQKIVGGIGALSAQSWQTPSLGFGFTQGTPVFQWRRVGAGPASFATDWIEFRGRIVTDSANTLGTIFTLTEPNRPSATRRVSVSDAGVFMSAAGGVRPVEVTALGSVRAYRNNVTLSFDGISIPL